MAFIYRCNNVTIDLHCNEVVCADLRSHSKRWRGGGVNHHHNIQVLFASTLHQMMRPTQLGAAQGDSPMTPFLMLGATPDPKIKATIWANQYTELGTLVTTTEPVVFWSINPQNQPPLTSVTHPRASRITTIGQ